MRDREKAITQYIDGYNAFDIDKMVADFDENIVFENRSNGETTLTVTGLEAFKEQAKHAASYFSARTQSVKSIQHLQDETQVEIDYHAVLATDFPNGMKKGDELRLQGTSLFRFAGGRITKLTDIS